MEQLLLPLAANPITRIAAARCGLRGPVPNLRALPLVQVDHQWHSMWRSVLSGSLQLLDISGNGLSEMDTLPAALRVDVGDNSQVMTVSKAALVEALEHSIEVGLANTQLANRAEVRELLGNGLELQKTWRLKTGPFGCRDLTESRLKVTPELFLPDDMCGCSPGFSGTATNCSPCLQDTFNDEWNQSICERCPSRSHSRKASKSFEACECDFGFIQNEAGNLSCQCPASKALREDWGQEKQLTLLSEFGPDKGPTHQTVWMCRFFGAPQSTEKHHTDLFLTDLEWGRLFGVSRR